MNATAPPTPIDATVPAFFVDGQPVTSEDFIAVACDPRRSVAVEACAGSGKTWMLVARIVRALLEGAPPASILAITFTRKAAGEMAQRLRDDLASLANTPLPERVEALVLRGLPRAQATAAAAQLPDVAAQALGGARGVQVRTIHAWLGGLLRAAPKAFLLRHGVPEAYGLIEDDAVVRAEAVRRVLAGAEQGGEGRDALDWLMRRHGRSAAFRAMDHALQMRGEFRAADAVGRVVGVVPPFGKCWPQWAHLDHPADALNASAARARWQAWIAGWSEPGRSKSLQQLGSAAAAALDLADPDQRIDRLRDALCPKGAETLRRYLQKDNNAQAAHAECLDLLAATGAHTAWCHHQVLTQLARRLVDAHDAIKRERAWLDMGDVERLAHALLADPASGGFVQERLDARYQHVLIDEFQDTNPLQWQAMTAWLEAYAGAASSRPAVFIVGDPKQSIYAFRGAQAAVFTAAQDLLREAFDAAMLRTDHTRRCSRAVVAAVNAVVPLALALGPGTPAVDRASDAGFAAHTAHSTQIGVVAAFPRVERSAADDAEGLEDEAEAEAEAARAIDAPGGADAAAVPWRDALSEPRRNPREHVHDRACEAIADWVARALADGRPAAQIMVLARKRERLARLAEHLARRHLPFDQPEQSNLNGSPAARDIVALVDALASPAHDLSLAQALRSPVFGWQDADLQLVAAQVRAQPGRCWFDVITQALDESMATSIGPAQAVCWSTTAARLRRWQHWLARLPLHDALVALYEEADLLVRFAQAAPPERRDADLANLRALLRAALDFEAGRFVTPYAFVRAFRRGEHEAFRRPAAAGTGSVRLLTIHGAKGLEAEVVIVLDTDAAEARDDSMSSVCVWPPTDESPQAFAFLAQAAAAPEAVQALLDQRRAVQQREEVNALYVAMTRASEQLIFSAVAPHARPDVRSWWRLLHEATVPTPLPVLPLAARDEGVGLGSTATQPASAFNSWPRTDEVVVESAMNAIVLDELAPTAHARDALQRAALGVVVHRLLQWPRVDGAGTVDQSDPALHAACQEAGLAPALVREAALQARRIGSGDGAFAWDPAVVEWAANEVSVVVDGQWRRIDRLVRTRTGEWWVLDYKLNENPGADPQLRAQLDGYRRAVQAANPEALVRAAFLSGDGRCIELTGEADAV